MEGLRRLGSNFPCGLVLFTRYGGMDEVSEVLGPGWRWAGSPSPISWCSCFESGTNRDLTLARRWTNKIVKNSQRSHHAGHGVWHISESIYERRLGCLPGPSSQLELAATASGAGVGKVKVGFAGFAVAFCSSSWCSCWTSLADFSGRKLYFGQIQWSGLNQNVKFRNEKMRHLILLVLRSELGFSSSVLLLQGLQFLAFRYCSGNLLQQPTRNSEGRLQSHQRLHHQLWPLQQDGYSWMQQLHVKLPLSATFEAWHRDLLAL